MARACNQVPEGRVLNYLSVDLNGTIWIGTEAALTGENYLVKSTDQGRNWEGVLQSPSNTTWEGFELLSISEDSLFFASEVGPWLSTDAGLNWAEAAAGDDNDQRRFAGNLGNRLSYSKEWGIIGVSHGFDTGVEQGVVNFTEGSINNLNRLASRFSRFALPLTAGFEAPSIVRRVRVSKSDMILAATNDGIWRFIPSSTSIDSDNGTNTNITESNNELPARTELLPNYPNPFNPTTTLQFRLQQSSLVQLKVYDMMGRMVAELINNERLDAGTHQRVFQANNLPSGIYLYRLVTAQNAYTGKMTLIK